MLFDSYYDDAETQNINDLMLADCFERISQGDPCATYDLANIWISHVFERDPDIELGIVEGLMRHSACTGNVEAAEFLEKLWPVMRILVRTRLNRCNQIEAAES